MARHPKAEPFTPAERARSDARRSADLAWLDLKRTPGAEVVSGFEQQLRIRAEPEVKIWRRGDRFAVAIGGRIVGDFDGHDLARDLTIAAKGIALKPDDDRERNQPPDRGLG